MTFYAGEISANTATTEQLLKTTEMRDKEKKNAYIKESNAIEDVVWWTKQRRRG